MSSSQYALYLKELEAFFKCPLNPDANNSCLINLKQTGIELQIEENKYGDLMIAVRLGIVPASRYRENLFKEALKANQISPSKGILGQSKRTGTLMIFLTIDRRSITLEKITDLLPPFIEKAQKWAEAIKEGRVPAAEEK